MGRIFDQETLLQGGLSDAARTPPCAAATQARRAWRASFLLGERRPLASARQVLSPAQAQVFAKLFAVAGIAGLAAPAVLLEVARLAGFAVFAFIILWRAALVLVGVCARRASRPLSLESPRPVYSVLIPLYREAACAPKLALALRELRYPAQKLDIIILLEDGDDETADALIAADLPANTRIRVVPPGAPRTKPRALNYGLDLAEGRYLAVYDAEDLPHPDQLSAAVSTFEAGGPELACLQAPLRARNGRETWLASQWALEYDLQFGLLLPAVTALRLPVPLGGTSNHFRVAALKAAGGWDAWNVTEDADLGARLALQGYRVGRIAPPTLEEAPERLGVWISQRSRWIKGFLQTWLVVMRRPRHAVERLRWTGFMSLQAALAGTVLSAVLHGPLMIWLAASILVADFQPTAAGLGLLALGYGCALAAGLAAPGRKTPSRLAALATLPLYWPLLSLAAARAVFELVRRPHAWAKTPHGLTSAPYPRSVAAFAE
ncbi:MAG: glycosyltransferase family 2 protein [Pseudomonadota bacterium]